MDENQHQANLLLGLTLHPQHFTPVQRRSNTLLGWAGTHSTHSTGLAVPGKVQDSGKWGHQWAQRSPVSYLILLGTPFYLVLVWFCIRCWDQKGVMKSLLLSSPWYIPWLCLSCCTESHKAAAAPRASAPGAGRGVRAPLTLHTQEVGLERCRALKVRPVNPRLRVWKTQVWIRIR